LAREEETPVGILRPRTCAYPISARLRFMKP
jgi:hypothetical protein